MGEAESRVWVIPGEVAGGGVWCAGVSIQVAFSSLNNF